MMRYETLGKVLVRAMIEDMEEQAQRIRDERLAKRQHENCSWEEWRARRGE